MIRKLNEQDRKLTLDFLSSDPAINLFIIGDIECYGFDTDFMELWGDFNHSNELEGVLLRFYENYIPYYKNDDFDTNEFKKIISSNKGNKIISGKESIVKEFIEILNNPIIKYDHFCELTDGSKLKVYDNDIKIATEDDAEKIFKILEQIEEFHATDTNAVERIKNIISSKSGRIYYIEDEEGRVITTSQTAAENSKSAMIVGVATLKEHRCKGLMSKCLSKLCEEVLSENKTLCLFYDNPKAGSVYHNIGFKSIDKWMMVVQK